jgi:endoglucanase
VAPSPTPKPDFVYQQNVRLGRGINLGNALEAPTEGEWGVMLEEDYFVRIAQLGFDSVRVPIRFSAHAAAEAPYTLDADFMNRVDWVVENALANDLVVILDMHHYVEIFEDPAANRERFVELWRQIAEHFQNAPDGVYFEPLNEPNGKLDADTWNAILAETIPVIREGNPNRTIIVGPADWYSAAKLNALKLPPDDRNIIVSVHYYQPFQFTHQGAEWVANSDLWMGKTWDGTFGERLNVYQNMRDIARWGVENDRPIFLGEFGSYQKADMASRVRWTFQVARKAEEFGMSWAYWEWCAGFGIFDPVAKTYHTELVEALIPPVP